MNNTLLKYEGNLKNNIDKSKFMISAQVKNNKTIIHSIYSDNMWNFSYKVLNNSKMRGNKIFFNKLTFKNGEKLEDKLFILDILKDCCYKMISQGLKIKTINLNTTALFKFLNYMYSELNIEDPSLLTKEQVNNYIDYFLKNDNSKSFSHINNSIYVVKNTLYKYRKEINYGIEFEPYEHINLSQKLKRTSKAVSMKQTEIIPDTTWQSMSSCCEQYLNNYLDNLENEKEINLLFEAALMFSIRKTKEFSSNYSKELSMFKRFKNSREHFDLLNNTQIAASIIIQAYTGMRASELYSLKTNCILTECVKFNEKEYNIKKIQGITFKYQESLSMSEQEGKLTSWLCPPIVEKAVLVLTEISNKTRSLYKHYLENGLNEKNHKDYKRELDSLFLRVTMSRVLRVERNQVTEKYKDFLKLNNIEIDFKLSSHCFRRTIARFFARSLIDIPLNALKEQFKHYSSDITQYYMKEGKNADSDFMELMEGYSNAKKQNNSKDEKLLFEKMQKTFDSSITSATNVDQLLKIVNGRKVKIINEYMVQLEGNELVLNPLESLTCDGVLILPELHLEYWKEMLVLYDELVVLEPNSIWYKQEKTLIENVVNKLKKKEVYITKNEGEK